MRAAFTAAVAIVAVTASAFAAALTPNEIQTTFFTGQPFTASAPNIKYKMIFSADGKMTREPIGAGGSKSEGTWKLTKEGFCSTWKGSKANCYRILTPGANKGPVTKGTTLGATCTK